VDELLAAHGSAEGFLDAGGIEIGLTAPQPAAAYDPVPLPARIGPYRVLRELGRGGMGTVYLAEREERGFRREVAVKVVRSVLDGGYVRRRFETERQILAGLEHPGIARLYDGGTTDEGLPYFVMEYVDGQDLLDYCDGRRLTVPERLRLFRRVCDAVQYAHQALVVHRDLKPSNVLVTAAGEPKLLDFGIAKMLIPPLAADAEEATLTMVRLLTPDYASPEHVRGDPVTTASDVYSLGVILYELLCGHRPYHLATRRVDHLERALGEEDPEAPSTVAMRPPERPAGEGSTTTTVTPEEVSAKRGETLPSRLRRLLSGDLDNIVLKALQKDAGRRYPTPAELADDIGRYLDGRPVLARPDRWGYRAMKFVRRHRVGVLAATVAVLSLLVGLGAALWQARVARRERALAQRRFDEARRLIQTVVFDIQPKLGAVAGATPLRRSLVESTLQYLEALARDAGDNPALLRELAGSYVQLARVQGDASTSNVGDPKAARETLGRAEELTTRFLALDPGPDSLRQAMMVYRQLSSHHLQQGEHTVAEGHARRAVEFADRILAVSPNDPRARTDLADTLFRLANVTESMETWDRVRDLYESVLREQPDNRAVQRALALVHKNQASLLYGRRRNEEGLVLMEKARRIDEALLAAQPDDPTAQMDLAIDLSQISGGHENLGDLKAAAAAMQQSAAMREGIAARNPGDARALDRLGYSLAGLGRLFQATGDRDAAHAPLTRAAAIFGDLRQRGYAPDLVRGKLAEVEGHLAALEAARGRAAAACEHYRAAAALYEEGAVKGLDTREAVTAGKVRAAAARCGG
jgi:non-specific serine/threonine protein kinase/serine/threonine-protein kinase